MRNGRWSIVNAHSGKNLCTMHWSKNPQSRKNQEEIIQYDYTGDPTHLWQMEIMSKPKKYVAFPFENKYVKIVNVHSGKNLCTMHWSKDAKSNNNQEAIIQYSYTGDPTHKWRLEIVNK